MRGFLILLYLVVFSVIAALAGDCAGKHAFAQESRELPVALESRETRVAILGDSLFVGWFPYEMRRRLGEDAPVLSLAKRGAGMSGVNEQVWSFVFDRFRPTHVIIYGGINDCMKKHSTPWGNAGYVIPIMDDLIQRIQAETRAKVIVMRHHDWSAYSGHGWQCSMNINAWLDMEYLMADPVSVIDTGFLSDGDRLCKEWDAGDGLHLNRDAHKLLSWIVYNELGL